METFEMKPGRGIHYFRENGEVRVLRPGDRIRCDRRDLRGAIDKFAPVGSVVEEQEVPPEPTGRLEVVARGKGWYDVVNTASGKKINDEALRRDDAESLVHNSQDEENDEPHEGEAD